MSSSDSIDLVQVKVRNSKSTDSIVFLPSKITKLSLCQCVSKVISQNVFKIVLNSIPIEREMIMLKDGDIIEAYNSDSTLTSKEQISTNIENLSSFRRKLAQENISTKSELDFIVLFFHFLMTHADWACIVEDGQSSVKGFAAPKRPLLKKWIFDSYLSADQKSKIFYKYKAPKGYQLTISCFPKSSDEISMTFSGEKSATRSFSLSLASVKKADGSGIDEDLLKAQFVALLISYERNFGETLMPNSSPQTSAPGKSQSLQEMLQVPIESREPSNSRVNLEIPRSIPQSSNNSRGDLSLGPPNRSKIGDKDLNPFGDILISPHPGIYRPSYNPFPESGGNLVGPNHPMFSGGGFPDNRFYDPTGGGGPLPVPRFDPYGPVSGPHGPNFGLPGQPPSFIPPGMVPPNTNNGIGKKPLVPGEPNPDHLKPPSENNDSMFG